MKRTREIYATSKTLGESVQAFVPHPLPPFRPALAVDSLVEQNRQAGYSSLASLTKLPLSELKIDQSFVNKLGVEASGAIIVQATIAMSQALGLKVIAEGVETLSQRDILVQQGCQRFQGFLFSRPVPIEEFEALLR